MKRLLCIFSLSALACWLGWAWTPSDAPAGAAEPDKNVTQKPAAARPAPTMAELQSEVEQLKQLIPDQAHIMADVSYHFTNLWFAGQADNWPLAAFYFGETKSHLHWAVRSKPKRKDSLNRDIDLVSILQAVENSPLKQLNEAIVAKDKTAFDKAYRFTIEGCYDCHKASDKPYLRLQIPTVSETQIINFDPAATWPR